MGIMRRAPILLPRIDLFGNAHSGGESWRSREPAVSLITS
jgi:hypothetical protein